MTGYASPGAAGSGASHQARAPGGHLRIRPRTTRSAARGFIYTLSWSSIQECLQPISRLSPSPPTPLLRGPLLRLEFARLVLMFALAALLIVLVAAGLLPTWVVLTALTDVRWRATR